MRSLLYEMMTIQKEPAKGEEKDVQCPLRLWSRSIEEITFVEKDHLRPVYRTLVEELNENYYNQKLFDDPTLFL